MQTGDFNQNLNFYYFHSVDLHHEEDPTKHVNGEPPVLPKSAQKG